MIDHKISVQTFNRIEWRASLLITTNKQHFQQQK
jgi:hypothetical protein